MIRKAERLWRANVVDNRCRRHFQSPSSVRVSFKILHLDQRMGDWPLRPTLVMSIRVVWRLVQLVVLAFAEKRLAQAASRVDHPLAPDTWAEPVITPKRICAGCGGIICGMSDTAPEHLCAGR